MKRMPWEIGCVLSKAFHAGCRQRGARSQTLRVGNGRPANLLFRRSRNPRKCAGWSARAIRYDSTDDRRCARVLGVALEHLDGGDILTHRLLCLGCDACGLLIAMYSDRCFSVWSDSGELEGRISVNPDRALDLLGEPSVTNIDVSIPGLSVCLSVSLSLCLSVCRSVCLSVCLASTIITWTFLSVPVNWNEASISRYGSIG